jgi:hypothetical protein
MRPKYQTYTAIALALVLLGGVAFAGGGNRVGSAGADQLLIPVGARGIALGSSYTAGITGVNAIYYNPAGLSGSASRAEAMFSQMTSIGDVGVSYFAVGGSFAGFGHLAFSIKSLSFGDIPLTDERNPDGSNATYAPTFVTLGLTYSRALTDRIRAGVTVNLVSESIERVSASGVAVDAGVQYSGLGGVRGLQMGVTLRHLGANMKYDGPGLYRSAKESTSKRDAQLLKIEAAGFGVPTALEIGLGYSVSFEEQHALTLTGAFENNNYLVDQWKLGAEYSFRNLFFVRASYNVAGNDYNDVEGESAYLYTAALGAGVNYDVGDLKLGVDYAYRIHKVFDGMHVFTVNFGF